MEYASADLTNTTGTHFSRYTQPLSSMSSMASRIFFSLTFEVRPPLVHKPEGRSYVVTRFEVLWDGKALPGVSASTFKDLGWGYGKDAFDVWWCGRKMPDATVYSFSVLGDGYAIDAFSVWYCGQEIKDAVSGSFRVLGDGYAEDGFNTYYYGKKVR